MPATGEVSAFVDQVEDKKSMKVSLNRQTGLSADESLCYLDIQSNFIFKKYKPFSKFLGSMEFVRAFKIKMSCVEKHIGEDRRFSPSTFS